MQDEVTIFTDGASRGNPGPGGWGAIIVSSDHVRELGGGEKNTTNNRMELMAAISALSSELLDKNASFIVYTDSKYLINGITKWVKGWQKNGWKTKTKEDVSNRDLWERLSGAVESKKIEWKYLGGHVGIAGNERADDIATLFADGTPPKLYDGPISGYKKDILNFSLDKTLAKEKSAGRERSKMKAYSYLSLVGGKLERHKTWAECEARVKGKPAKFKKAISAEDEQAILKEWGIVK